MSRSRTRIRLLVVPAAGALAAGVIAAAAQGGDKPRAPRTGEPARPVPVPRMLSAPLPCRPRGAAARRPPSEALLRAFGVLRRERTDRDALPAAVLQALRRQGLGPVDPSSARLLRSGRDGARAWIVPVPDVNSGFFGSRSGCRPLTAPPRARVPRHAREARARARALRARELRARAQRPRAVPPAPVLAAPLWPARTPLPRGPQEGVAVVSVGGAPGGGGGSLRDLIRGRASVGVDPCFGARRDMVGISGIVPDGAEAAFLTAEDGSAVRADVIDNSFTFVVPRDRRPQQRYVVWSGADGTPHVQSVFVPFRRGGRFCPPVPERIAQLPRVSPGVFDQFGPGGGVMHGFFAPAPVPAPARPAPLPAPSRPPRRPVPVPVPRQAPPPAAAPVPRPVPAPAPPPAAAPPQAPSAVPAPEPPRPR